MVCELRGYTANFHVGFDETTLLLRARYSDLSLDVMYCYDLAKHTEPSIQTARAVQAPMEGTKPIVTNHLAPPDHYNVAFLYLAVHEIRDSAERELCLRQLRESVVPEGRVIVIEHAHDLANFLA